jgi:hypothetical protein
MPRKKPDEIGKKRMNTLTAAYHPDAVKYMLDKHGNGITDAQAKEADQEWASNRAQTFSREISRGNTQSIESLMQEPPLGAGIPLKRSDEFDYAKANVGIQGMAVSESAGESEARFTKPTANFDTSLARP